jgi:hypothetical protein
MWWLWWVWWVVGGIAAVLLMTTFAVPPLRDALRTGLGLLVRSVDDLYPALRSIVWSFRGAPPLTEGEADRLLARLNSVTAGVGSRPTRGTLYKELGILDAKAASLQQINAIGVAIVVFLPTQMHSLPFRVVLLAALVLLVWSVVTIAPLNLVSWGRGRRSQTSPDADVWGGSRASLEGSSALVFGDTVRILRLLRLSDLRSNLLRRATVRSVLAFLILASLVGVAIIGGESI